MDPATAAVIPLHSLIIADACSIQCPSPCGVMQQVQVPDGAGAQCWPRSGRHGHRHRHKYLSKMGPQAR